jgi:hypothetical protein
MPIVMNMHWDGIDKTQYESIRKLVNWEGDVPPGAMYHVASFDERGIHVTDVWESAEDFQRFADSRLMPGVRQLGITGDPQVTILPSYTVFTPAYQPVSAADRKRRAA